TVLGAQAGLEDNTALLDDAEKALEDLHAGDPARADYPFILALSHVVRAQRIARDNSGDKTEIQAQITKAWDIMHGALAGQENNPAMLLNVAQVRTMMLGNDQSQTSTIIDETTKYLEQARKSVKDDDVALHD